VAGEKLKATTIVAIATMHRHGRDRFVLFRQAACRYPMHPAHRLFHSAHFLV
jgi:hypothetical protein